MANGHARNLIDILNAAASQMEDGAEKQKFEQLTDRFAKFTDNKAPSPLLSIGYFQGYLVDQNLQIMDSHGKFKRDGAKDQVIPVVMLNVTQIPQFGLMNYIDNLEDRELRNAYFGKSFDVAYAVEDDFKSKGLIAATISRPNIPHVKGYEYQEPSVFIPIVMPTRTEQVVDNSSNVLKFLSCAIELGLAEQCQVDEFKDVLAQSGLMTVPADIVTLPALEESENFIDPNQQAWRYMGDENLSRPPVLSTHNAASQPYTGNRELSKSGQLEENTQVQKSAPQTDIRPPQIDGITLADDDRLGICQAQVEGTIANLNIKNGHAERVEEKRKNDSLSGGKILRD